MTGFLIDGCHSNTYVSGFHKGFFGGGEKRMCAESCPLGECGGRLPLGLQKSTAESCLLGECGGRLPLQLQKSWKLTAESCPLGKCGGSLLLVASGAQKKSC